MNEKNMDEKAKRKRLAELKMSYLLFLKQKLNTKIKKQIKVQNIQRFSRSSLKDPDMLRKWKKQGRESALKLVEALKQGIKGKNIMTKQFKALTKEQLANLSTKERQDYLARREKHLTHNTELIALALEYELKEEKIKNSFPKNYERLLRLRDLKQKALKKLKELQAQNKPSKLVYTQEEMKEFHEETKRMNKSAKEHPEKFWAYLRKTGQLKE